AMNDYYTSGNANIHRGIHELAEEATSNYESARARIAKFIHSENPNQLVFTRNTTESINLVANTWAKSNLKSGDLILLTEMEHHSNLVPWFMLAEEKCLKIEFIPITNGFELNMVKFHGLLNKNPKLVAFTHMSNMLGTINPAEEITRLAHDAGAMVLIDGAQAVPHFSVNVQDLSADFYAFSAHKMLGPTGIGALYAKAELLETMPPFMGGGDMIRKVTYEGFSTNDIPYKFEAGTPAIAEGIGFGAAVDYLETIGMNHVFAHEQEITRYAIDVLGSVPDLKIHGPAADKKGGVVSFSFMDVHPHDISQILDAEGIAVRAGHHCVMPLHRKLNLPATTRASLYLYNTKDDINKLAEKLENVRRIFS
ncbi:MAG: cysteine desulfurase, partial [Chloroflexi bacterium]|nr:cysteine desulfurase [Chloroflexota bacterium]